MARRKIGINSEHAKPGKGINGQLDDKGRRSDKGKRTRRSRSIKEGSADPSSLSEKSYRSRLSSGKSQASFQSVMGSPNYMKSTRSFEARMGQSPGSVLSDGKKKRGCDVKQGSYLSKKLIRSSSLKLGRMLKKTYSFKVVRVSSKIPKVTCSSTLKDVKFPSYLELHPGGTEAEGTSVFKVCPYKYCSLNGHYHTPVPPLKYFIKARRYAMRAQMELRPEIPQPARAKTEDEETTVIQSGLLRISGNGKLFNAMGFEEPNQFPSREDSESDSFVEVCQQETANRKGNCVGHIDKEGSPCSVADLVGEEDDEEYSRECEVFAIDSNDLNCDLDKEGCDGEAQIEDKDIEWVEMIVQAQEIDEESHLSLRCEESNSVHPDESHDRLILPTLDLPTDRYRNEEMEEMEMARCEESLEEKSEKLEIVENEDHVYQCEKEVASFYEAEGSNDAGSSTIYTTADSSSNGSAGTVEEEYLTGEDVEENDDLTLPRSLQLDEQTMAVENITVSEETCSGDVADSEVMKLSEDGKQLEMDKIYTTDEKTDSADIEDMNLSKVTTMDEQSLLQMDEMNSAADLGDTNLSDLADSDEENQTDMDEVNSAAASDSGNIDDLEDVSVSRSAHIDEQNWEQIDEINLFRDSIDSDEKELDDLGVTYKQNRLKELGKMNSEKLQNLTLTDEPNQLEMNGSTIAEKKTESEERQDSCPVEASLTASEEVDSVSETKSRNKRRESNVNDEINNSRRWSIGCGNLVMSSDDEKDYHQREPNFLPVVAEPEGERVDLKHQEMDSRRNADEWMIDHALQQAVSKLASVRKKKVELMVEAFETVLPVQDYKSSDTHSSDSFSSRPIQALG